MIFLVPVIPTCLISLLFFLDLSYIVVGTFVIPADDKLYRHLSKFFLNFQHLIHQSVDSLFPISLPDLLFRIKFIIYNCY